jgi:hypothetical protein
MYPIEGEIEDKERGKNVNHPKQVLKTVDIES